jgi:K+-transporting ATPase ATPase A chain
MNGMAFVQIAFFLVVLLVLVRPLGAHMAGVYAGRRNPMTAVLAPVERAIYRFSGVDPEAEMSWKQYAVALLAFNAIGFVFLYLILRLQHLLPLNL